MYHLRPAIWTYDPTKVELVTHSDAVSLDYRWIQPYSEPEHTVTHTGDNKRRFLDAECGEELDPFDMEEGQEFIILEALGDAVALDSYGQVVSGGSVHFPESTATVFVNVYKGKVYNSSISGVVVLAKAQDSKTVLLEELLHGKEEKEG